MGRGYFGIIPKMYHTMAKAKELLAKAGYKWEPVELLSEQGRCSKDGELTEAVAAQLTEACFNVVTKFVS